MLKKYSIDFVRIKNTGFKGKAASYKSYGVWKQGESCDKYFADVMFCFQGRCYLREFGVPGANKDRKAKQLERLYHWTTQGGCDTLIVTDMQLAIDDWKVILGSKYMEIM